MGSNVFWVFINIVVPVFAPLAVLRVVEWTADVKYKGILLRAVDEGQLFWVTVAMAAAACYDLMEALYLPETWKVAVGISLVWHVLVIIFSVVIVTVATMQALDAEHAAAHAAPASTSAASDGRHQAAGGRNDSAAKRARRLTVSIQFTAVTALTFTVSHMIFSK